MATNSTNLGLVKPDPTDYYDSAQFNENMDILDEEVAQKAAAPKHFTAALQAAYWLGSTAPYTQTVTVTGLLSTDRPIVDVALTGTAETDMPILEAWGLVSRITTAENSITAVCYEDKPEVDIPIQMEVIR